jgi:DNA repair protein RadC
VNAYASVFSRATARTSAHLKEYELLELLLSAFIPRVDVKPIAKDLIARFGSVAGAQGALPERLMEVEDIGETAASYRCATNLLTQRAAHDQVKDRPVNSNWAGLLNYVSLRIRHEKTEQACVLYLDRNNKLITGGKAGHRARSIMRRFMRARSPAARWSFPPPPSSSCTTIHAAIPRPRADIELTRETEKALAPPEIKVHDHLVVGAKETISMKAKGLICSRDERLLTPRCGMPLMKQLAGIVITARVRPETTGGDRPFRGSFSSQRVQKRAASGEVLWQRRLQRRRAKRRLVDRVLVHLDIVCTS